MKIKKTKTIHILLVEDNEGDIFLTLEAFEECKTKTEISVVRNGQEALDFVFQRDVYKDVKKPDLILLDINIPIFNGHQVLKKIKTDTNLKKIPVIMLTTSTNKKDLDEAYENYCNSYIEKPLNISEFLEAIKKIEQFWLELILLAN